jgi:hypothetical protein
MELEKMDKRMAVFEGSLRFLSSGLRRVGTETGGSIALLWTAKVSHGPPSRVRTTGMIPKRRPADCFSPRTLWLQAQRFAL